MCRPTNSNIGVLTLQKYEFEVPLCKVWGPGPVCHDIACCDLEKPVWDKIIEEVIQPIQTAVQVQVLGMKVQDLTARVEALSKKAVAKT
jgi:hypothetical protein